MRATPTGTYETIQVLVALAHDRAPGGRAVQQSVGKAVVMLGLHSRHLLGRIWVTVNTPEGPQQAWLLYWYQALADPADPRLY